MLITKTSQLTGKGHTMNLDVTHQQINLWLQGAHIQDVMPQLSPGEREFLISGIIPEEWESVFGKYENK